MGVYQGDKPLSRYGKSAYQQAVEGGYTGTQEEFNALLASVGNKQDKITGTSGQVAGFDADGNLVAQEAPSGVTDEEKAAWNAKADVLHASQHASDGSDPITPDSIGAYSKAEADMLLQNYAAKSDIPSVPDAVSAFTNDVGYLTEHQDISGKLDTTGDGSNVVVSFTAASSRSNILSGEKLSSLFGKLSKWFSDFGSLAFKSTVTKTDLESSVQTSLSKADSALQSYTETDPTVPEWAKSSLKPTYTADEVGALSNTLKNSYDTAYAHSQTAHAPSNAEQNVQSDWSVTDTNSDAYIKNKPDVATQADLSAIEAVLTSV